MWTKENIRNQSGKTVIVTGANTGIGYETALAFYQAGAHVLVACRDENKAQKAIASLNTHAGDGTLEVGVVDLASLASVKPFADHFLQHHSRLDVLINNAGVMVPPASVTNDGFELQFGVNFLGHFALTGYLYPLLKQTLNARVVTLTSLAYRYGTIDFDNLRSEKGYDAMREYSQSKLADLLFTIELQKRITTAHDRILSVAAHPGVTQTDLSRNMEKTAIEAATQRLGALMETAQGALPSLYAAVSSEVEGASLYGPDQDGGLRGYPAKTEIDVVALNATLAAHLWQTAERLTGVIYP
ncbi:SDR family NAD(P)-dependent oxidoreductase [Spirosoma aureum]|uniref:SDR family NAD(P)-dependent oxidoreductase n=1 Tax=Spirosoma aureum TaxID=2692134 RepID=A0A6G9AIE0_9BACT|nr:oxidoreductase [Spirosoma aureum]QIP12076.1 SDR family NAD(P)-dependent oxidoreductase [Spirosoma aureum]